MRRLNIGSFVLFVFALSGLIYGQQLQLDPPVDLTDLGTGESRASSYDVTYRAWRDGFRVMVARSFDGGQTWEDPIILTPMANSYTAPVIVAAEENVYVAWHLCNNAGGGITPGVGGDCGRPSFAVSNNWGETFSVGGGLGTDATPIASVRLSAFASNIFMAWNDCILGRFGCSYRENIFLEFSVDAGRNWRAVIVAGDQPGSNPPVKLLSYDNDVYVFWRSNNGRVFMRHGTLQ